jgi:hypothetical protein
MVIDKTFENIFVELLCRRHGILTLLQNLLIYINILLLGISSCPV